MYELNAEGYTHATKIYMKEFHRLLVGIVLCYKMMIKDNVKLPNDENKIRNSLLLDYLNNDDIRKSTGLIEFTFNREVPENDTKGRTDIKVEPKNPLRSTKAYYIIECKRLDDKNNSGVSGLNADYIKDGICRFVSKTYSTFCGINGLIGFIVARLDIDDNTEHINTLAATNINCNMIQEIQKECFIPDFEYHYSSMHKDCEDNIFTLYHLMFDYSNNINEKPANTSAETKEQ
jgi:hypothetical protein